jgi:hypothetical protein
MADWLRHPRSARWLTLSLVSLLPMTPITTLAADYRGAVLADSPSAYWRLGEAAGPTARDSAGSHDATLNAVAFSRTGAITNDNDTAFGFDGSASSVTVPYSAALNSPAFSIECWAKANSIKGGWLIRSSSPSGGYGLVACLVLPTWQFGIQTSGWLFLHSRRIVTNRWTHLVGTFNGSNLCLYADGVLSATEARSDFPPNTSSPTFFGTSTNVPLPGSGFLLGDLDEVAVYDHALPEERVVLHYGLGKFGTNVAPVILRAPSRQDVTVGSPASLVASAYGDPPPAFQWYKDGSPVAGATCSALAFSSTVYGDTGLYSVGIENALGATNSQAVKLSVMPPPRFCNLTNGLVLHLGFEGDYLDSSGRNNHGSPVGGPTFVTGQIGSGALHYSTDVMTGVSNFVTLGTPADLQFSSNVNFSVSYWVRFTGLPGDLPFLCNSANSFGQPGFTFAPSYKAGGWSWSLVLTGAGTTTSMAAYGSASSINDDNWHHLLHSFDREGEGITYLDGVQVNSHCIIVNTGSLNQPGPVNIGQDASGHYPESGEADLDDLGVWRRVLSPCEAQCVFLVGKNHGLSFDSYGPVEVRIVKADGDIEIVWQAGLLERADDVNGPWEPVSGAAPPYCKIPANELQKFYRVRL